MWGNRLIASITWTVGTEIGGFDLGREQMSTTVQNDNEQETKRVIRLDIPPRFFYVTGTAIIVGTAIGIVRGGRLAGMRFLAENVHRPPTTVEGWYFYNKTKNYKVMLGGLKGAGMDSLRLGLAALGWVGTEEGVEKLGWGDVKDSCAGVVTAGAFSAVCECDDCRKGRMMTNEFTDRLPWKMSRRTLGLGMVIGGGLDVLRWGRKEMERRVETGDKGRE